MGHGAAGRLAAVGRSGRMGVPMKKPRRPKKVTSRAVLAEPEERRLEVIGGVAEEKAAPSFTHSLAQTQLAGLVGTAFGRRGGNGPGGWWILAEVDVELGPHDLVRPDLSGWRRERIPSPPRDRPVRVPPDWVCEVISPGHRRRDTVEKVRLYHRVGVSQYWLVDPEEQWLWVLAREEASYRVALMASGTELVRAPPFPELEFSVAGLLGEP